jgi:hypothetical protein
MGNQTGRNYQSAPRLSKSCFSRHKLLHLTPSLRQLAPSLRKVVDLPAMPDRLPNNEILPTVKKFSTLKGFETIQDALHDHRKKTGAAISELAIDGWFDDPPAKPTKDVAHAFLLSFLITHTDVLGLSPEDRLLWDRLEFTLSNPARRRDHPAAVATPPNPSTMQLYGGAIADILLDRSRRDGRDELEDFFYCSPRNLPFEQLDQSYYFLYRFASTGRVIRTFVVFKRPQPQLVSSFTFVTFMRSDPDRFSDWHRESEGLVSKWEWSYQLIGFSYRTNSIFVDDPEQNVAARRDAKKRPRHIELYAFEYAEIDLEPGLFSGVTFTSAASNQPVVARVAMLHLGTSSSLGKVLSHKEAKPRVFDPEELQNDLKESVKDLRDFGCSGFAPKLNAAATHPAWDNARSAALAKELLTMLDNTPAWERMHSPSAEARGRGAIGSFTRGDQKLRP